MGSQMGFLEAQNFTTGSIDEYSANSQEVGLGIAPEVHAGKVLAVLDIFGNLTRACSLLYV